MNVRSRVHFRAAVALLVMACGCTDGGGSGATESPIVAPSAAISLETPLPSPWTGRVNPLPDDAASIARGHAEFVKNCAPCHGVNADGKGPASASLQPPPANFLDGVRLASHSDAYLFMRIATGKHGTAMPAFAGTLPEDDRWAILRFLRSLPGAKRKEGG